MRFFHVRWISCNPVPVVAEISGCFLTTLFTSFDLRAADQTSLEERLVPCVLCCFLVAEPCLTSQSRTSPPTWTATRCSTSFEFGGWTIASVRGVGIGAVGNPFFGGEAVNICLHSRSDVGDPFCSNIRVCLCITDQCSLPPAEGSPICVCFNKKLAGGDGWSGQQLFDWSTSFGDTFWLYYIFCMGLGFSAPQANGRPILLSRRRSCASRAEQSWPRLWREASCAPWWALACASGSSVLCHQQKELLCSCALTFSTRKGPQQSRLHMDLEHLNATDIFWMLGFTSVPAWQHHNFEDDVAGLPWTCKFACFPPMEGSRRCSTTALLRPSAVCDCHPCQELVEQKESSNITYTQSHYNILK